MQEDKNGARGDADAVPETLLDSVTNILYAKEDIAEEEGHEVQGLSLPSCLTCLLHD